MEAHESKRVPFGVKSSTIKRRHELLIGTVYSDPGFARLAYTQLFGSDDIEA